MIAGVQTNDYVFGLSRDVMRGEFNRYRNRPGHMGTKWQNPLSFKISFIKDVCSEPTQRNLVFTEEEVNAINAWLTSPDYPTLFHMYDYDFERDSLNNMILIDHDTETANLTIYAEGYYPATYQIEGEHCRILVDETDPTIKGDDLLVPPKPRVKWHGDFFSLQYYMDSYPSKVTGIYCNDGYSTGEIEIWDNPDEMIMEVKDGVLTIYGMRPYKRIETNEWLSSYDVIKEMPMYVSDDIQMSYPISAVYPHDSHYDGTYTILLNRVKVLNVKYDYFGTFTDITPQLAGGNVIGFNATFTCDSPFAWTQEIYQYLDTSNDYSVEFNCSTAEKYREVYPTLIIHVPDDGDDTEERATINIDCLHDDVTLMLHLMKGATTTIDCQKCTVSYVLDEDSSGEEIYDSIQNVFWDILKTSSVFIKDHTMYINVDKKASKQVKYDDLDDLDWATVAITSASITDYTLTLEMYQNEESAMVDEDELIEAGYDDTRFIYWPRLYYGSNGYRVLGDCTLLVQYREPRKVGDW